MKFLEKNCLSGFWVAVFVFICGALTGSSFAASSAGAQQVTLQEVLENVTKTDPSILESFERYTSILAERGIAKSEFYPTIGTLLSVGAERTDGVPTNDRTENLVPATATLFARQNLYNGGQSTAFVAETDARILAAAYDVLYTANNVYLACAESYIDVVRARELLAIAEENALTQERIMRQVREKTEAGFNLVSELYNSESRLALAKASYISRQQDLNQALAAFHRQFGQLLTADQFVRPEANYQSPANVTDAVALALQKHPALKVAKYNIETRRYTYERSLAANRPTIDFELRTQYRNDTGGEEGDTNQSGAYVTLNYDFWDGGRRESQQARDKHSIRKEYQRSYIERRNVNETVRLAWNIMEAESGKSEYLVQHVALSRKTLEAFKEEYYAGRRTLLDLLNMENEYTDSKISMIGSEFSYLTALYRMKQATGLLLDEYVPGLRKGLNLPAEDGDNGVSFEGLDENRDKDVVADISDQCDNTAQGSAVKPAGCTEENVNHVGYPHTDATPLPPYIDPGKFAAPAETTGQ